MVDETIGQEISGGDVGIAKTDQDQRHIGAARGAGIGDRVPDHDGARDLSSRPFDGGYQVSRVRLGSRRDIRADDSGKSIGHPQGLQQSDAQICRFVRADRQSRPRRLQVVQGGDDPIKGAAQVGDMGPIMGDEGPKQPLQALLVETLAGRGEATGDQGLGALTDEMAGDLQGEGRQAFPPQKRIQRPQKIGGRFHKGAVEIEDDGRAGQNVVFRQGDRRLGDVGHGGSGPLFERTDGNRVKRAAAGRRHGKIHRQGLGVVQSIGQAEDGGAWLGGAGEDHGSPRIDGSRGIVDDVRAVGIFAVDRAAFRIDHHDLVEASGGFA